MTTDYSRRFTSSTIIIGGNAKKELEYKAVED
jgi:hypothetical protein